VNWQVASFLVLVVVLAFGFAWYERSRPSAKVLSLVAALAALATVGRIAFAPIPNVKPTTDIALFAGYALGPIPGFAVGAVAALASNVFFGQGPWTPWQMVGWGGAGVLGGLLAWATGRREIGRWPLAAACAVAGALFGLLMDAYQWIQGAEQDLAHYLAVSATSLPYNVAHVIGNIAFCLLLGPTFVRALSRYRRRFSVRWAVPAAALLVALAVGVAAPPHAEASTSSAVAYLRSAQNSDGGFAGSKGASSTALHTGWAALGLAAAGVNPADVKLAGGSSVIDYMRAHAGGLTDIGEIERTVLALDAAGVSARSFAGRDLVKTIERRRSKNGSWKSNNGWTAFGILALKATGGSGVKHSAHWLAGRRNRDGGFGFRPGAASDVDDTGAVLQALAAAGMRNSKAARRAVDFLRAAQNRDGGFGQLRGGSSNAQSTSWAVQGLVAAGRKPSGFKRRGHSPLSYLRSLQRGDGSVRYSRTSAQTPVWVTAQAIDAFTQKAFPLKAAPRVGSARARHASPGGGTGTGSGPAGGGKPAAPKKTASGKPAKRAPAAKTAPGGSSAGSDAGLPPPPAGAPSLVQKDAPPSERASLSILGHPHGRDPMAAWAGGALVAAVAALALWRLGRHRGVI
jgi:energy-coupling factor transport system substrate-specific component